MDFIYSIFGYLLKGCSWLVGNNYVIALFLFAVAMKVLLFPLGIKQQKNLVKQARLRPKEMAIRKRYAGRTDKPTQDKQQQEIMELYQKENFNPMGGCLPLLLQLPIIFILYQVIRNPLQYLCNFGKDAITAIAEAAKSIEGYANLNIASGDLPLVNVLRDHSELVAEHLPEGFSVSQLPNFDFFGLDLSMAPNEVMGWMLLIPVITFVGSFLSMKLTRKFTYQAPQQQDASNGLSMKIMDLTAPLLSTWVSYTLPGVIGIYWLYQNILGVAQQFILSKMFPTPVFTEEELKQVEKEMNSTVRREKDTVKKQSLHHIDDGEVRKNVPAEKKKAVLSDADEDRPALKEDRNGNLPEAKTQETKKRSLHHIDDDE